MKIWVEIGENYYELDAEGDQEEFFEPSVVEVHYDGLETRKDYITFTSFQREWCIAHPKKSCVSFLHERLLQAYADEWESGAE